MVRSLFAVWRWCIEKGVNEDVKRKDFKHLFLNENEIMRFADWKYFIPSMVYGDKRGFYSFDIKGLWKFFNGETRIPFRIIKNPLTGTIKHEDFRSIREVPKLMQFLDENQEFIVNYQSDSQSALGL